MQRLEIGIDSGRVTNPDITFRPCLINRLSHLDWCKSYPLWNMNILEAVYDIKIDYDIASRRTDYLVVVDNVSYLFSTMDIAC